MKKPKDKNQPVTSGEFQELRGDFQEFAEFITNTAATKDDLKEVENKLGLAMIRLEAKIEKTEERLEEKITDFKDVILNSNDKLVRKLDTFLTEQAMMAGGQSRHETDIKHLKQRVTHLEVKAGVA